MRVLILGAGGHAQVVADILLRARDASGPLIPVGYLDDDPRWHNQSLLGLPVLGSLAVLSQIAHDAVILGIGDNYVRRNLFTRLQQQGECFAVACHPRATVAPDVTLGPGSMVCAGCVVNPGSVIEANVILNTGCIVDHHSRISQHAHIAPGARLGGEVTIGEGTLIGIGATVMPRRRVGAWSVIGAAALVHEHIPDRVVALGVPAHIVREHDPAQR